jgi:tetratricopeptide (TPR) repeat protein
MPAAADQFVLQGEGNNVNSSRAEASLAQIPQHLAAACMLRSVLRGSALFICAALLSGAPLRSAKLDAPPAAYTAIGKIYSGDPDAAIEDARRLEQERPEHPLGYLLEGEALWWKIWCTSAEFKYGMTYARHRAKLAADQHYLDLAAKASSLADAQIARSDTASMQFYAGMADALAARLYGLRGETRNGARAGVRAREHLLRALALDPGLADAEFGLGLYNYYADTLSGVARVLRFFMGIPGGSKQDGIRQLEHAIAAGEFTRAEARFYLALCLHNYDQKYQDALEVAGPLADQYSTNPLFQLIRGDLYSKLGRKEQAAECYRTAGALPVHDLECRAHIQDLVRASLAAIGAEIVPGGH